MPRSRRHATSDVPTRSTGYQDELEARRREAIFGTSTADSDREAIASRDTSTESETPLLDSHDQSIEDYWSDEAVAARAAASSLSDEEEQAVEAEVAQDSEVEAPAVATPEEEAREHETTRTQDQVVAQGEEFDPSKRQVSGTAMARVAAAKAAINHTKTVLNKGAGNQFEALSDSNFNSYFRMQCMRDPECWNLDPALYDIANKYPDALVSAKANLAAGGNCGEHAMVAFDYLRMTMSNDIVNRCDVTGLDHAFVILGNLGSDSDEDLAVCDPWPTAPTACLWDEHFAFSADRGKINTRNSVTGDDQDVVSALAAGLSLSKKGEQMIQQELSKDDTEKELEKGTDNSEGKHGWIWRHSDTTSGAPTDYQQRRQS